MFCLSHGRTRCRQPTATTRQPACLLQRWIRWRAAPFAVLAFDQHRPIRAAGAPEFCESSVRVEHRARRGCRLRSASGNQGAQSVVSARGGPLIGIKVPAPVMTTAERLRVAGPLRRKETPVQVCARYTGVNKGRFNEPMWSRRQSEAVNHRQFSRAQSPGFSEFFRGAQPGPAQVQEAVAVP